MIKKAIKASIRAARAWLREDPNLGQEPVLQDGPLYMNATFAELMKDRNLARRPHYVWGVLQGARLSKVFGLGRVSVIEFGVAGGNGLLALERIGELVEDALKIEIDVYGFDTGEGLPKPQDHRDVPYHFIEGSFQMDQEKLQSKLKRAKLILGDVGTTVPKFICSKPSPIAFIANDLDLYSSTMQSFKILEADQALLLPRILCYFDDIMGMEYGDCNGERLAISDFNASHSTRQISPIYGLKHHLTDKYVNATWPEMIYTAHIFDHDSYGCVENPKSPSLNLVED
jgi:hypothetical protein